MSPVDAVGGRVAILEGSRRPRVTRTQFAASMRYFLRRTGFYMVTTILAVTLNFIIPRFMPGNPADIMAARIAKVSGATPTPQQVADLRAWFGNPTENIFAQYVDYWRRLVHLDFGVSVANYPVPVKTVVFQALPWTLVLVGTTTVIAWIIGTLIGAYMGWRPGNRFDSIFAPLTTFLHAVPIFWLAILALWAFAMKLHWAPLTGGYDPNTLYQINNVWFLLGVLKHTTLPALVLIFVGFNGWLFSMRNVMVTTVTEDYVVLARAKGLSESTVLLNYAARNAILPNVTGLALAIGGVIGGTVLVEVVFTYPGMGFLLQQSITQYDFPVMQTILILLTFLTILSNYIADIVYGVLDPRTREV